MVAVTEENLLASNKLMNTYYTKNVDTGIRFSKKWDEEESPNYDKLLLARNLYDLNELKKAAHVLKDQASNINDQSSMFMHNYSEWMHADMKMREERYQAEYETSKPPPAAPKHTSNFFRKPQIWKEPSN